VLLSGLMVAVFGILLCLFAHNSASLIILGRVLQGIGAGCASVIARVSLRDRYEGSHLRQAMAYFGIVMAFVPTITPLAGGFLTTHFGWVSIFFTMAGGYRRRICLRRILHPVWLRLASVLLLFPGSHPGLPPENVPAYQGLQQLCGHRNFGIRGNADCLVDPDEVEDTKELWDSEIEKLKRVSGL
jgi:MFS family permease